MAGESKVIAELLVKIGVDTGDAEKAAKGVGKRFDGLSGKAKKLGTGLKAAGKAFAVFGAAATAAAAGVFKFVDSVTQAGDDIGKEAKKIGVGTTELQRLRFAAERSGTSSRNLSLAIKNSAKQLEDASNGGAKLFRDALEDIGLSLEDVQGLTAEERLALFADRLGQVGDEGKKTALAMNLFGARAGPDLLPLLQEGSDGIRALGDEAERLGIVIDEEGVAASERFQDRMTDLKATLTGVKNTIGVALIPAVEGVIIKFRDWVLENRALIDQKLPELAEKISEGFEKFLIVVEKVGSAIVFVAENFEIFFGFIAGAKVAQGFAAVATGFSSMGIAAGAALGPIGAIAGALIALIPLALKAGNALGDVLTRGQDIQLRAKKRGGARTITERFALKENQREAARIESNIARFERKLAEEQAEGFFDRNPKLVEFYRGKILEEQGKLAELERQEEEFFPDIGEVADEPITTTETFKPPKPPKTPRAGGRKKITSPTTVSEFFRAAAAGDLGPIAARTPNVKDIEPTVAVDITNNNYKFEISQDITGQADPARIGEEAARAIKKEFEMRLSVAGQQLATSMVR